MKTPHFTLVVALVALLLLTGWVGETFGQELNAAEEEAIRQAIGQIADSVVQIEIVGSLQAASTGLGASGRTTGTIISEDGFILSSLYAFEQDPSGILVVLPGGKRVAGRIVSRDTQRNLALLKVENDMPLAPAEPVPRSELRPGQWCLAVGKVFSAEAPSVSVGILSATHRVWGKAVQTDAKISPNNYGGPLLDIRGKVIGILTPLSPQDTGPSAGLEWYDSGIGFAVPLSDLEPRLDTMKQGEDLQPGLLGISLEGNDIVADPAKVAAVRYNSPAQEAGMEKGDVVIEANGQVVERQAQLKHVLGEAYAGDKLTLKLKRGDGEEVTVDVTLAAELVPYQRPLLGIILKRWPDEATTIAFVFPESVAARTGIQTGDRVIAYDDTKITSADDLRAAVATADPNVTHKITLERGDEEMTLDVEPEMGGDSLATAPIKPDVSEDTPEVEGVVSGESEFQLAEEQNEANLFVPEIAKKVPSLGLVVLLKDAEFSHEANQDLWHQQAEEFGFAVLEIAPANGSRWTRPETSVVRKMIDKVADSYAIDPERTILVGGQSGGAMALIHGFENRDAQAGAVAIEAALPRGTSIPDNEPLQRLELIFMRLEESEVRQTLTQQIERLREMKFPVVEQPLDQGAAGKSLTQAEIKTLSLWLNALDRI